MGFRKALSRKARTGGAYVNGVWAGESETTTTIQGSVQPTTGRQRDNIPEGYDSPSALLVITDTKLVTADAEGQRGDRIQFDGEWYAVVNREPWQNDVLNHYAYVIALEDNPAARS